MTHFTIRINPNKNSSSDILRINDFHPLWKEAYRQIKGQRLEDEMNRYAKRINEWTKTPSNIIYSNNGLSHINLPIRGGLDLFETEECYRSHNIHAPLEIITVTSIITHYINFLNLGIRKLDDS